MVCVEKQCHQPTRDKVQHGELQPGITDYQKLPSAISLEDSTVDLEQIYSEPLYYVMAPVSLLLQLADPIVAVGTHRHSNFAKDPFSRLRRTMLYIHAVMCGSYDQRVTVCNAVNRRHATVRGAGYDANDWETQRWVAATVYYGVLVAHETMFGSADYRFRESLCRAHAAIGTSLKMPMELWPESLEEFDKYWMHKVASLRVTDEAREICHILLYGSIFPWYIRWILVPIRVLTAAALPSRIREEFGLPDPNTWFAWLAYHLIVTVLKILYHATPRHIRCEIYLLWRGNLPGKGVIGRKQGEWSA